MTKFRPITPEAPLTEKHVGKTVLSKDGGATFLTDFFADQPQPFRTALGNYFSPNGWWCESFEGDTDLTQVEILPGEEGYEGEEAAPAKADKLPEAEPVKKLVQVPSSLEFDFCPEDVCEILEKHVRDLLARAENLQDVSAHYDKDGNFFVAVWSDGSGRVSAVKQTIGEV